MSKDTTGPLPSRIGRRRLLAGAGASALAGLAGCIGTIAGQAREVNVAGSSTVFPITEVVSSRFSAQRDDVTVSISQTGTGGGFSNFFCPGMTDINNASREIADVEEQQCGDNDVDPVEFQIAIDALTVVVHPEAEWIDCLTVEELRQIWAEDGATRWSDVRGEWPDEEIEHYGADTTSGTFDYFAEAVLGEDATHRTDYHATERDRTIVQGVQGNEYAIGYFGFAYYDENPDQIKAVAIDDGDGCTEPSIEAAREGTYTPLSRPLFIYADKHALERGEVRDFLQFYLEQAATETITEVGYVPVPETVRDENLETLESATEEVTAQ